MIDEILNEIKSCTDTNTFNHLNAFITVKLNGYKIIKEETALVKYEMTESQLWYKKFFITKKLQGLSERTLKYYKNELDRHIKAINKPLDEVTTDDIRYLLACYQIENKMNKTTLDNIRRVLNTFFQFLNDEGYIQNNPCRRIKKVKQKKKIKKPFTPEELEILKMECEKIEKKLDRKRAISLIEFLISTGSRAEELTNVKLSDVDLDTGEVFLTGKGNKERIVYLNSTALLRVKDYISARKDKTEYLFVSNIKPYNQLRVPGLEIFIRELGKKSNIENVHPHRFRRTCATMLKKRGMPIEEISKYLGHESMSTTQIYIEIDSKEIKKSHEKFMN